MNLALEILQFVGILFLVLTVFNLLIIVHEWGHFLAGRWRGLHIDRFQIWFGKPIWKYTHNGVQYGLGSIPFGGFVSLPQMAPMDAIEGKKDGGEKREPLPPISPLDKSIVAFAGPLFSFLLAVFCALLVWWVGKPVPDQATAREVGYVVSGSAADQAGIVAGDEILAVNGNAVERIHGMLNSVDWFVVASEQSEAEFQIRRGDQEIHFPVAMRFKPEEEDQSHARTTPWWTRARDFVFQRPPLPHVGILGCEQPRVGELMPHSPAESAGVRPGDLVVALNGVRLRNRLEIADHLEQDRPQEVALTLDRNGKAMEVLLRPRLPEERPEGLETPMLGILWDEYGKGQLDHIRPGVQLAESVTMMRNTLGAIANPDSKVGAVHLSSAIGIMRIYYRLFQHPDGWRLVLWFSVVLNINLAVLNLLPLPVLDGGHIVMSFLEWIRGRPLPIRMLKTIQTATAILLLGFMAIIALKDIGDIAADTQVGTAIRFLPADRS